MVLFWFYRNDRISFQVPKDTPLLNSCPLFTGFLLISGLFSKHYCTFIRPWTTLHLFISKIPFPSSYHPERAYDHRWIFSVLTSQGVTDNLDSGLLANMGQHCGTKSLLPSGPLPLILCSKRNANPTFSSSHAMYFACFSCLHFCLVFFYYLLWVCKVLWSYVERR